MIPKECKRLAEVDFPIAEVSRYSAREKSIRHGLPSTIHLWWARRPLAACRAVLLALLLPDPCDEHCPSEFKTKARELLAKVPGKLGPKDEDLRSTLLKFIGDFANWDLTTRKLYLETSRGLVKAAHGDDPPLVVDPFAGGGSIPLEALRLGCDAFASDLNPVACIILKVMLEDIPRNGQQIAEQLHDVGTEIKKTVEKELAQFYPPDPDGSRPIAYLWARTVRCEQPDCGAEIPLVRSLWLCKKLERRRALRLTFERPKGKPPFVKFEIFEPKTESEVPKGTVSGANATCVCCHKVLPAPRVRAQLSTQRGGADVVFDETSQRIGGAVLLAVVTLKNEAAGRYYRLATELDYAAVQTSQQALATLGVDAVPHEPLPPIGTLGFRVQRYGMLTFENLFTSRQIASLSTIARAIRSISSAPRALVLALGKLVDLANAICRWEPKAECPRNVFGAGRVKPAWDFAEGNPIGGSSGSFEVCIDNLIAGVESVGQLPQSATCEMAAAQNLPLPDGSVDCLFTDPPYYNALPYADLSDVFFVWLKRSLLNGFLRDPFDANNALTPKEYEIVQDESRQYADKKKDKAFFEEQMAIAFRQGARILKDQGIGAIVFAHKTTEGWEALISGIIAGGFTVTASWPIATEQAHRLRAKDSAALGTSVHLVCRPRVEATVGDWGAVLRELPGRVADWMKRLQSEGVHGADLIFACIGPALEVFSRYSKVETAEGREVGLPAYLEKVWEIVGRAALEQVLGAAEAKDRDGGAGALEEDARLTALFLWTLQSTEGRSAAVEEEEDEDEAEGDTGSKKKGLRLIFDVVRRFAQPLGIHLESWEGRIVETEKGVVRLIPVRERTKQLFGEDGAQAAATRLERSGGQSQLDLFPQAEAPAKVGGRKSKHVPARQSTSQPERDATTLDRVHVAMLFQASGQANALRALLRTEQQGNPDFLRLANALSALYPKGSEEKRLLDAMLLAVRK